MRLVWGTPHDSSSARVKGAAVKGAAFARRKPAEHHAPKKAAAFCEPRIKAHIG